VPIPKCLPSSQEAVNNLDFGLDRKDEHQLFGDGLGWTGMACGKNFIPSSWPQGCMSQPDGIRCLGPMRDQNTEKPHQPV